MCLRISNLFGIGTGQSAAKRAQEEASRQAAAAAEQAKAIVDWQKEIAERSQAMVEEQWALTRPLVQQQVATQQRGITGLGDFLSQARKPVAEVGRGRVLQHDRGQRMVKQSQAAAKSPFAERGQTIKQSGLSGGALKSALRGNEILAAQAASKAGTDTQRLLDDFLLQQAMQDRESMYAQRLVNRDIPYSRELSVLSALAGVPVMPDTASSSMAGIASLGSGMSSGITGAAGLFGDAARMASANVGLNPLVQGVLGGFGSEKISKGLDKLWGMIF